MRSYIFLTGEGFTYQPPALGEEDLLENLQVLGVAAGDDAQKAFANLLAENAYLVHSGFGGIFSYPLARDYDNGKCFHNIQSS